MFENILLLYTTSVKTAVRENYSTSDESGSKQLAALCV